MSDTPKQADDVKKLLDNDWLVVLYANEIGSYTAVAAKEGEEIGEALEAGRHTDDFEPSQALYRLTEKITTGRVA